MWLGGMAVLVPDGAPVRLRQRIIAAENWELGTGPRPPLGAVGARLVGVDEEADRTARVHCAEEDSIGNRGK